LWFFGFPGTKPFLETYSATPTKLLRHEIQKYVEQGGFSLPAGGIQKKGIEYLFNNLI